MRQWHVHVNGQQHGPISQAELMDWMASGRVSESDLVWSEGMAEWQPAGSIDWEQLAAETPAEPGQPQPEPEPPLLDALPSGTGGSATVGQLISRGLSLFMGSLWLLLVTSLVYSLVSGLPGHVQNLAMRFSDWQPTESQDFLIALVNVAWLFVLFPMQLGISAFFLRVACGQPARVGNVFDGFKLAGAAIRTGFMQAICILLWSLLLIIPGIIAALRYSQAFYLVATRPGLAGGEALRSSSDMMKGHKGRYFMLSLALLLVGILVNLPYLAYVISQGGWGGKLVPLWAYLYGTVANLLVTPFAMVTFSEFHRDLNPAREV